MEPQLPTPHFGPESAPQLPKRNGETFSGAPRAEQTQEAPVEQGFESREVHRDGPQGDPVGAQAAFTPPPLPVIDPAQVQSGKPAQQTVVSDAPAAAADEDLIEKEWVEKAKRVVAETRNDPHAQEDAISRLQADYLQKRYGRTIKLPSDG